MTLYWQFSLLYLHSERHTYHSLAYTLSSLKMGNLSDEQKIELIKKHIGSFPDFPKEGIMFRWASFCFEILDFFSFKLLQWVRYKRCVKLCSLYEKWNATDSFIEINCLQSKIFITPEHSTIFLCWIAYIPSFQFAQKLKWKIIGTKIDKNYLHSDRYQLKVIINVNLTTLVVIALSKIQYYTVQCW